MVLGIRMVEKHYYVYGYLHPEEGWIYIGLTTQPLERRLINQHLNSSCDNIERRWVPMLEESSMYYMELSNEAEMKMVELYFIDKYKPLINKKDVFSGGGTMTLTTPKWKKFVCEQAVDYCRLISEEEKKIGEVEDLKMKLAEEKQRLKKKELDLEQQIQETNTVKESLQNTSVLANISCSHKQPLKASSLTHTVGNEEIITYYERFPHSNLKFYGKGYKTTGKECGIVIGKETFYVIEDGENSKELSWRKDGVTDYVNGIVLSAYEGTIGVVPESPQYYVETEQWLLNRIEKLKKTTYDLNKYSFAEILEMPNDDENDWWINDKYFEDHYNEKPGYKDVHTVAITWRKKRRIVELGVSGCDEEGYLHDSIDVEHWLKLGKKSWPLILENEQWGDVIYQTLKSKDKVWFSYKNNSNEEHRVQEIEKLQKELNECREEIKNLANVA